MPRLARHIVVSGRVQGVGYRWWVVGQAEQRNLAGWVRNRADGTVEIAAIGEAEAVKSLIEACWTGPSAASVRSVEVEPTDDDGSARFEQKATV